MVRLPPILDDEEMQRFFFVGTYIWKKTNGNNQTPISILDIVNNVKMNMDKTLDEWEVRKVIDQTILAKVFVYNGAADKVYIDSIESAKLYFKYEQGISYPHPIPCPRCHNPAHYIIIANPPNSNNPKTTIRAFSCKNDLCGWGESYPKQ